MARERSERLSAVVDELDRYHGEVPCGEPGDPLGMILWVNVAYLVDDVRRARVFAEFEERIGLSPEDILDASDSALREVAALGGMLAKGRVAKLRAIAEIAHELGGLEHVLAQPLPKARRILKRFPGIGDPGVDKILLFTGTEPILALESNGLRTLLRLGYGEEAKSYRASYKSAQRDASAELAADCSALVRASRLLRRHGQEVCRRTRPACEICPVTRSCRYYRESETP